MENESDLRRYTGFLARFRDRSTELENDSVYTMVRNKAPKVAAALGWADWAKDIEQETLLKLAQGKYRGEGSLDGYIAHVMWNEVRQLWRKEGRNRREAMPEDLEEPGDFTSEIESSERVERLKERSPKHLIWYIEAIIDYDGYLSEREAAIRGGVKRHRIAKLREELRRILESMEENTLAKGAGD